MLIHNSQTITDRSSDGYNTNYYPNSGVIQIIFTDRTAIRTFTTITSATHIGNQTKTKIINRKLGNVTKTSIPIKVVIPALQVKNCDTHDGYEECR